MNTHRIHRVAKLTGLSKDVIRVWERRYGLVQPSRGSNRYRIYTDEDVSLLRYVKSEMDKGHSIGDLAALGHDELLARMKAVPVQAAARAATLYDRVLGELIAALEPLDRAVFERKLNGAVAVIPFEEALHGILLPLQERVGQLWYDGRLNVAVEHYVTRQVQQKLFSAMNHLPVNEGGPEIVVACPPTEAHEIGAQTVAYHCRARGCRVYYLGALVPLDSLASFCTQIRPSLLLLSLTTPSSEPEAAAFLQELSSSVGSHCPIAAGGRVVPQFQPHLAERGIQTLEDFVALDRCLDALAGRPL
ncbi:MAG: MerR family transcriptional regulator [Nitrospira sp.]|nr:MerR family transcriptional regulator [Nitrospira sp.]